MGDHDYYKQLQEMIAGLDLVHQPTEADWVACDAGLGIKIPEDYKRIISTVGSGTIRGYIFLLNPTEIVADYRLELTEFCHVFDDLKDDFDEPLWPLCPEPDCLWMIACTGTRNYFHFDPVKSEYCCADYGPYELDYFNCSLAEFLITLYEDNTTMGWARRRRRTIFMEDDPFFTPGYVLLVFTY